MLPPAEPRLPGPWRRLAGAVAASAAVALALAGCTIEIPPGFFDGPGDGTADASDAPSPGDTSDACTGPGCGDAASPPDTGDASGDGGADAAAGCAVPADCAGRLTLGVCQVFVCTDGACGVSSATPGAPCEGDGDDPGPCAFYACGDAGQCAIAFVESGTDCGEPNGDAEGACGDVCDGAGTCAVPDDACPGDACRVGTCVGGTCSYAPTAPPTDCGNPPGVPCPRPCDDGDGCTVIDTCDAMACLGATHVCPGGACNRCDPALSDAAGAPVCVPVPLEEAVPCNDGDPCTAAGVCDGGSCVATGPACEAPPSNACVTASCTDCVAEPEAPGCADNEALHVCALSFYALPGGCADGNQCTVNDTCVPVECGPERDPACEPGTCRGAPLPYFTPCETSLECAGPGWQCLEGRCAYPCGADADCPDPTGDGAFPTGAQLGCEEAFGLGWVCVARCQGLSGRCWDGACVPP